MCWDFELHSHEDVVDSGGDLAGNTLQLRVLVGIEVFGLDIVVKLPEEVCKLRAVVAEGVYW